MNGRYLEDSGESTAGLSNIRHFLLDLDGTVYLGQEALDGAIEFISYLRRTGRKYLFLTNNPTKNAKAYARKLAEMGIETTPDTILTSGEAAARYLHGETAHRKLFAIGTPSFEAELTQAGFELTSTEPDAIVLAFDTTLTYAKLETAALLLQQGAPYYATNPDKVCPMDYGAIPDCGATAALLFEATGKRPKYIGKPNPEMARTALAKLNATPANTAMVGDRLYTDMQLAYAAGIASILVLSGETQPQDLATAQRKPGWVFESLSALLAALQRED